MTDSDTYFGAMIGWAKRYSLPGKRHYWHAFAFDRNAAIPDDTRMRYDLARHYWYLDGVVSIPWAVTDDYGNLVAVQGPDG